MKTPKPKPTSRREARRAAVFVLYQWDVTETPLGSLHEGDFDDYTRASRSHTLPQATAHTHTILATARGLLASAMPLIERQGLTLVGVAVANLDDDRAVQLALPFDRRSDGALDAVLDEIRARFGSNAVTRAVLLGRDQGIEVPLLPD